MVDYLIDVMSIFNSLATVRFPTPNTDFTKYVVDGLGLEYQSFITSLHFCPSITFDKLYAPLFCEKHLQKKYSSMSSLVIIMVVAQSFSQSSYSSKSSCKCNFHGQNTCGRRRGHGSDGQSTPH